MIPVISGRPALHPESKPLKYVQCGETHTNVCAGTALLVQEIFDGVCVCVKDPKMMHFLKPNF